MPLSLSEMRTVHKMLKKNQRKINSKNTQLKIKHIYQLKRKDGKSRLTLYHEISLTDT